MSNLIPLNKSPKYLAKMSDALAQINDSFASGIEVGKDFLAKLSIKGGKFSIPVDGEREIIRNGTGKKAKPAMDVNVVVMAARDGLSKAYYDVDYDPDDPAGPVCQSDGGVIPDPRSSDIQCVSCTVCDFNKFGSGKGKGKACTDRKELVVALMVDDELATDDDENIIVYNLSIPPTSLKNWKTFIKSVTELNAPVPAVVTAVSQCGEDSYPEIDFEAVGYVPEDVLKQILARVGEDDVQDFLETEDISADADADEPAPKKLAPKKAKKAKPPVEVVEDEVETIIEEIAEEATVVDDDDEEDGDLDLEWEDDDE